MRHLFHSLKEADIFKWQNVYLHLLFVKFAFFFCISDHIFVLSNKNSDLTGPMPSQKKKLFAVLK